MDGLRVHDYFETHHICSGQVCNTKSKKTKNKNISCSVIRYLLILPCNIGCKDKKTV